MTDSRGGDAWPIRTARLDVRRCTPEDLDAVWEYRRLPEAHRWLGSAPSTRDEFRERLLASERLDTLFVIDLLPESDRGAPTIIGDVMVRIENAWAQEEIADDAEAVQAELGWVLDPAHTGRGYATEAMRAVIGVCFGELGLRRVHAGCFADNEASWRLMERLGMRREEFSRRTALHRSGVWLDGMNYGLLADEWPPQGTAP